MQRHDVGCVLISIHALLAESDIVGMLNGPHSQISIHALLAESDYTHPVSILVRVVFLSTLSLRRATLVSMLNSPNSQISIHALLAESDYITQKKKSTRQIISIHALLAESDPRKNLVNGIRLVFLSTLSLRRATLEPSNTRRLTNISIHALLAESDPNQCKIDEKRRSISIHALLAESDLQNWRKPHGQKTFLSTLSLRRATTCERLTRC